jgi:hypothetical protein
MRWTFFLQFADLTQEEFRSSYLMPAAAPVALQGTVSIQVRMLSLPLSP